MAKKGKKAGKFGEGPPSSIPVTIPDDVRKRSYIRALQSDRVTVLVDSIEAAFQVPQDLLIQYSKPLGRMCSPGFIESETRIIRLPEVEVPVFEDFLVWIHAYEPSIDESKSVDALVDLAVFGEIYLIHHLKNQTSDVLRTGLDKDTWRPTPDIISKVYKNVPSGSILRQLCLHGFVFESKDVFGQHSAWGQQSTWGKHNISTRKYGEFSGWKAVFEESADFGWDYFQSLQIVSSAEADISSGGTCRFHDHSDIVGWRLESESECPSKFSWWAPCSGEQLEQALGESTLQEDEISLEVEEISGPEVEE